MEKKKKKASKMLIKFKLADFWLVQREVFVQILLYLHVA